MLQRDGEKYICAQLCCSSSSSLFFLFLLYLPSSSLSARKLIFSTRIQRHSVLHAVAVAYIMALPEAENPDIFAVTRVIQPPYQPLCLVRLYPWRQKKRVLVQ